MVHSARVCSNPILPNTPIAASRGTAPLGRGRGRGRGSKLDSSPGRVISTRIQTGVQPRISFAEDAGDEDEEEKDGEKEEEGEERGGGEEEDDRGEEENDIEMDGKVQFACEKGLKWLLSPSFTLDFPQSISHTVIDINICISRLKTYERLDHMMWLSG